MFSNVLKILPKCFLFRPAIERGRPLIPEQHATGFVMHDKGIVGGLQELCLQL